VRHWFHWERGLAAHSQMTAPVFQAWQAASKRETLSHLESRRVQRAQSLPAGAVCVLLGGFLLRVVVVLSSEGG
jgi:hypothetical protein